MPDGGAAPGAGPDLPELWGLSQLLAHRGLPADPAFVLGLSGGAGFLAVGIRNEREDFSSLHLSGWNPFQSSLVGAVQRLGVAGAHAETGNARKAARHLREALAAGEPAALWVDGARLGLAPAAMEGMAPTVVVAEGVADGGIALALPDGGRAVVAEPDLAAARGSIRTQRHRLMTLRGAPDDLPRAVRGGLAALATGPIGGPKGDGGPDGVAALAERMTGEGRSGWGYVFHGDRHLLGALVSLHASVAREAGLLRGLQAGYDRHAAELLGIEALHETAAAHDRLAAEWRAIGEAALPADVPALSALRALPSAIDLPAAAAAPFPLSATETQELLTGLSQRVQALAAAESDALEQLRATLTATAR